MLSDIIRPFAISLVVLAVATGAQEHAAGLDLRTVLATKGPAVVRCGDGLLAFGTDLAIPTGTHITLKRHAVTARVAGDLVDHPNKTELAELMLIALEGVVARDTPQTLTTGKTAVEVMRNKEPVMCDVAEVLAGPPAAEFDKPVTYRQMNLGGRPVTILNLQYLKKQPKRTADTCIIRNSTPPDMNRPLTPELHAAFMEELTRKQQKLFKNVVLGDAGSALAYELQLRVLGFGFMDGEGDVAFVSFRVVNRASGKIITHGRGFRVIGTKQDKDVRDFANVVACL